MSTTTAVKKSPKQKAMELIPTKDELLEGAVNIGGLATGVIGSHVALTAMKQDNIGIDIACLGVGYLGACKVKQPFAKAVLYGVSLYGGLKLLNKAGAAATDPSTTQGLAGMLPENVKAAIRKYIPTIAGIEELTGLGDPDISNLSLDDQGFESDFSREEQPSSSMGYANAA